MRTKEDEETTRVQVEEIAAKGIGLTVWERDFITRQLKWISASLAPFWHADQAAKIEQICKARVK